MQPELRAKLDVYDILLRKWQPTINLISSATLEDLEVRHFQDSLQILPLIPASAKHLYDLGSGAGFPGMVLAMARPDLSVHLIESDQRKSAFLQTLSRETSTPVKIHTGRIEGLVLPAPDVVTARALADLPTLLALTKSWWSSHPDLVLIFLKGVGGRDEVEAAKRLGYKFDLSSVPSQTAEGGEIFILSRVAFEKTPSQDVNK